MTPFVAAVPSVLALAGVVAVGTALAGVLVTAVDRLSQPGSAEPRFIRYAVGVAVVVGAVALWWWEVVAGGQLPRLSAGTPVTPAWDVVLSRYAGHLVLFTLLAMAAWIDFRERLIPDGVTVPGVLLGLLWNGIQPDTLLPIATEVPRSFAAPTLDLDVLGAFGGLQTVGVPALFGPRPVMEGLAAAVSVFAAWWAAGTVPAGPSVGRSPSGWDRLWEPRIPVAIVGLAVVVTAWFRGDPHWSGVWAALAGIFVSAAIVWLTRIGASRALGQEALGFGDVTLMAMAGAWLGWQACLLACCLAVFIGLGHGLAQFVLRRENELPFGPSLCLALVIVVVTWRPLWERAEVFFSRPTELAVVVMAVILLTAVSLALWQRFRGGGASGQA